jgi:hypothetical protein
VPGQDGPHIEEDEMFPTMITALGAERIREWHEKAARDRLLKDAHRARHAAPASATRLAPLRAGFGRRTEIVTTDERAGAADAPPPGRRAA